MSSNIITRLRYKKDVNFQRLVGGWCKYVKTDLMEKVLKICHLMMN